MAKLFVYLSGTFCVIWFLLSILAGAIAKGEKDDTKDGSWKVFGVLFIFCVINAVMYGIFTYLLA